MSSSPNSSSSSERPPQPFEQLHDVVCAVDIVLGTAVMNVRDCLHLRKQAIIRIDQAAGTDMDIIVNGVLVAHGEVMIVDDTASIRVTEVLPPPSSEGTA